MYKRTLLTLGLLLASCVMQASQQKSVSHMQTVSIDLSIKDPNIISVKNDRIKQYAAVKGAAVASIDSDSGILNIKPTAMFYEKPFSMIVFTEKNMRYTLISNPRSIPAQDIVLENKKIVEGSNESIAGYEAKISNLIKAMIHNNELSGYKKLNTDAKTNKENLRIVTKYSGDDYIGEVLTYVNKKEKNIRLTEDGFYDPKVLAISLSSNSLRPGEMVKVYRVVKNG